MHSLLVFNLVRRVQLGKAELLEKYKVLCKVTMCNAHERTVPYSSQLITDNTKIIKHFLCTKCINEMYNGENMSVHIS